MTRIATGCRLHFGLTSVAPPFGGCGVMIDAMPTILRVTPSERQIPRIDEAVRSRFAPIIDRIGDHEGSPGRGSFELSVLAATPPHRGLGSGTQLALAAAELLLRRVAPDADPAAVASAAARGERSRVGLRGYFGGGYVAHRGEQCRRVDVPRDWRFLVAEPLSPSPPIHGATEREIFESLVPDAAVTRRCDQMVETISAAFASGDFDAAATSVETLNRTSGSMYESFQGDCYRDEGVGRLVESLKSAGATGVGQTSWGPAVFAMCRNDRQAENLASRITDAKILAIAAPKNSGRKWIED